MLDRFDRQILSEIQRNARISNTALAEVIGISEAPCWRRVKRLESEGYVLGYHARLNRRELGLGVLAFVHVRISAHDLALAEQFEAEVLNLKSVQACHNVTGADDYILQVLARDLDDYSDFTVTVRRLPGVIAIHSSLSLREVKNTGEIPV